LEVPVFITDLRQVLAACKQHLPSEIIPPEALAKLENPSNMRLVWFPILVVLVAIGIGEGGTIGKRGPGLGRASGEELGRLLGFRAEIVIGQIIETVVPRRWPALRSPPITRPTTAPVQHQGPARRAITSTLFWLGYCAVMLTALAATGSWVAGV